MERAPPQYLTPDVVRVLETILNRSASDKQIFKVSTVSPSANVEALTWCILLIGFYRMRGLV
jgi:hypothetical protein